MKVIEIPGYGRVTAEVTDDLKIRMHADVQIDPVLELKALAARTATKVDDSFIAMVETLARAALRLRAGK